MTVPKVEVVRSCDKLPVWQLHNGDVIIESNQTGTKYQNNLDCHWMVSSNTRIELVFMIFETEYVHDVVQVYDGESSSAPLIGGFNGSSLPSPVTSSSSKLFLRFTTDHSVTKSGFRARFRGMMPTYINACFVNHKKISRHNISKYFQMKTNDFPFRFLKLSEKLRVNYYEDF